MTPDEVERGLAQLAEDLSTGRWDRKYGALRTQAKLDVGYRYIIADAPSV